MEAAISTIEEYIQREYEALRASYEERDDSALQMKIKELERSFAAEEDIYAGVGRARNIGELWFKRSEVTLRRLIPRVLFQVKKYEHAQSRELYRGYLSGTFDYDADGYSQLVYLADTGRGLRIISLYSCCLSCSGRGAVGLAPCEECGRTGWVNIGGRKIANSVELVEVRKLQPPVDAASLVEYHSE